MRLLKRIKRFLFFRICPKCKRRAIAWKANTNLSAGDLEFGKWLCENCGYAKVFKVVKEKCLVYGIVLEPDKVDSYNQSMDSKTIEDSAHEFLSKSK